MTPETASVEAEALEWTIRVQHPDFAEWDALTAWLMADPRHAECFDRLTLRDDEVATALCAISRRGRRG
jgi:transmembrane sensor